MKTTTTTTTTKTTTTTIIIKTRTILLVLMMIAIIISLFLIYKSMNQTYNTTTTTTILLLDNNEEQEDIIKENSQQQTTITTKKEESTATSSRMMIMNCTNPTIVYHPYCIQQKAKEIARTYNYHSYTNWIFCNTNNNNQQQQQKQQKQNQSAPIGLLLVKTYKAASTTVASVVVRIAHRRCSNTNNNTNNNTTVNTTNTNTNTNFNINKNIGIIGGGWYHKSGYNYKNRQHNKSFLITIVREPTIRAISRIFFTSISQRQQQQQQKSNNNNNNNNITIKYPTDKFIINTLKTNIHIQFGSTSNYGGFQTQFLSLKKLSSSSISSSTTTTTKSNTNIGWIIKEPTKVQNIQNIQSNIQKIINDYNFILIAERLDESLVVMSILMNIPIDDIIVSSSKISSTSTTSTSTTLSSSSSSSFTTANRNQYYFKQGRKNKTKGICIKLIQPPTKHLQPIIYYNYNNSNNNKKSLSSSSSSSFTTTATTTTTTTNNNNNNNTATTIFKNTNTTNKRQQQQHRQQQHKLLQEYITSKEWLSRNYGDYLLHTTANYALDYTITNIIGKTKFNKVYNNYIKLKEQTLKYCSNDIYYPCSSSTGKKQILKSISNCYIDDIGCGYKCIDNYLLNLKNSL